jgi:hypothetical protein
MLVDDQSMEKPNMIPVSIFFFKLVGTNACRFEQGPGLQISVTKLQAV